MGLVLSWVAVHGREMASVLSQLGLVAFGETSDEAASDYGCAELAGGWLVVTATKGRIELAQALQTLSADGAALGGELSEIVMVSRLCAFEAGRLVWSVTHDPDRDGVEVIGSPPPQLEMIRRRLQAEQSAAPGADYIFDVPLELGDALCGYRPGRDNAPVWTVLRKAGAPSARGSVRPSGSLSAAMRSELVPMLQALGWDIEGDLERTASPSGFFRASREVAGFRQVLWFDFKQAEETYLIVNYSVWDVGLDRPILSGRGVRPPDRRSPWNRFLDLAKPSPAHEDPVAAAISGACEEIEAIDRFLKTGERGPRVYVEGGLAKDTWPSLPEH